MTAERNYIVTEVTRYVVTEVVTGEQSGSTRLSGMFENEADAKQVAEALRIRTVDGFLRSAGFLPEPAETPDAEWVHADCRAEEIYTDMAAGRGRDDEIIEPPPGYVEEPELTAPTYNDHIRYLAAYIEPFRQALHPKGGEFTADFNTTTGQWVVGWRFTDMVGANRSYDTLRKIINSPEQIAASADNLDKLQTAADQGYEQGYDDGFKDGHDEGFAAGREAGRDDASKTYAEAFADGYARAVDEGLDGALVRLRKDSRDSGYSQGHADGFDKGFAMGREAGREEGYSAGFDDGLESAR